MAVLRLKSALFLGALAGLAPLAATQPNYTSYSDLDMARAQLALENSRPADCPPWYVLAHLRSLLAHAPC